MLEELVVLGYFKGIYNTEQGNALSLSDEFPSSDAHKIKIYNGKLTNTSFFKEFTPHEYLKLSSVELLNVPNVEIESGLDSPYTGTRKYACQKFILIEPKILSKYELNGKTYGEIEGQAYVLTEKNPVVNRLNPDITPISPKPTDFDPVPDPLLAGCRNGCFSDFWKIIRYLLLILLLWFLFKACIRVTADTTICERAEITKEKVSLEKKRLDSITSTMNSIIEQALANISIIYFYQNTTDFHLNSIGVNGSLDRLTNVIKSFPESRFSIIGFHSGKEIEDPSLDKKRANRVIDYLVEKGGVKANQLDLYAKGDSTLIDVKDVTHDFEGRGFNRNMRVEIKLIKQ